MTEFQKVLALNDTDPIVSYNLGVALLRLNKDAEGIHELQMFVARAGRTAEADVARRMIDEPRRARENFAPPFSITTKNGEYITLDDLKGKVILLDFWGTWCGPCREATPSLVRYSTRHSSEKFVMIGIAVSESSEQGWREYIEKNKMNWPQYLDTTRKIASLFNITSYPTYITIDAEGIVRDRRSGWGTAQMDNIDEQVRRADNINKKTTPPKLLTKNEDRGSTSPSMPPAPVNLTPTIAGTTSSITTSTAVAGPAPVVTTTTIATPVAPAANTVNTAPAGAGVTVRGRVIRSQNPPVAQAVPVPTATRANLVKPAQPGGTPLTTTVVIAPDGTFEFPNVQPGNYILNIGIPVPVQPVVVGSSDISGLEFEAPNIHSVPVRVTTEGLGSTVPRLIFTIAYRNGTTGIVAGNGPDGTIRVLMPEGEHRVTPNVAGFRVKSLTYGSIDVLKDPLKIGPTDREDLVIALVVDPNAIVPVAGPRGAPPDGVILQGGRGTGTPTPPPSVTPQLGARGPGATTPTSLNGQVVAPKAVRMVQAEYTDAARQARITGTVGLRATVRKDGTVDSVQVVQSLGYGLDEVAVAALKQWTFQPGTVNGVAVDTSITAQMNFTLGR